MKHTFTIYLTLIGFNALAQNQPVADIQKETATTISPKLLIPLGTIAKLDVEIYDGDLLHMKGFEGTFLLKVVTINDQKVNDTLLLTFVDETGKIANNNFNLYEILYKKKAKSLTSDQVEKLKKNYIGNKLQLMAYETGHFTGIPKDYYNYQPVRAATNFHFEHYLVVVSKLER